MESKSWTYRSKAEWNEGEWTTEPDKVQWLDEKTGYPCLIVRGPVGALCGYVGVSPGHPLHETNYNAIEDRITVHGGLTYSGLCQPDPDDNAHGICHVVEPGEDDRVWWFGFDCAHYLDLVPGMIHIYSKLKLARDEHSTYRNIEYVKAEVRDLAAQLHRVETTTKHEERLPRRTPLHR